MTSPFARRTGLMIADALRIEIDDYCVVARKSNPLFRGAKTGTVDADTITTYLVNIHALVEHTPAALSKACVRARQLGLEELATHYEEKRIEEHGHDAWSASDIQRLTANSFRGVDKHLLPSMKWLIDFINEIIETDPI